MQACEPLFGAFRTGSTYNTTIGYPPEALSTLIGAPDGGYSSTFSYPEPTSLFQSLNYTAFQQFWEDPAQHPYERGHPYLKMPPELTEVDPAWKSCVPAWYGSWDPPRALSGVTAMMPPPTSAADPSSTADPAAPASGIASVHVPASSTTLPSAQTIDPALPFLSVSSVNPPAIVPIKSDTQSPTKTQHSLTMSSINGGSRDHPSSTRTGNQQVNPDYQSAPSLSPVISANVPVTQTSLDPATASQDPSHPSHTITGSAQSYTIAGSAYTMQAVSDEIHVAGQTLSKGSHIDIAGVSVSYDAAGTAVIIGSNTQPFTPSKVSITLHDETTSIADSAGHPSIYDTHSGQDGVSGTRDGTPTSQQSSATNHPPTIHLAGSTYTASTSNIFIIADQTLAPGSAVTISGTRISYDKTGGGIVVGGSSTISLQSEGTSAQPVGGLGSYIIAGFGSDPTTSPTASREPAGSSNNASNASTGVVFWGGAASRSGFDARTVWCGIVVASACIYFI